jgi:hypothetical protein
MRKSPLQVYAPFLAVVLAQALFITVAPSTTPRIDDPLAPLADDQPLPPTSADPAGPAAPGGSTPSEIRGLALSPVAPGDTSHTADPGGSIDAPPAEQSPGTPAPDAGGPEPPTTQPLVAGDTSHCTDDGRQHDVLYFAPPCATRWADGDNGGATYRGVTADKVRVVVFAEQRNEAVTQILSAEGLRDSRDTEEQFMRAAQDFLNSRYEFHGREVELVMYRAARCPETPPDIPGCRAEAREALKLDPFAVIWAVPTYPEVFDEWVREGVIVLGGWHFDNSYFAGRRPYRYDVFMDGTQTAEILGEYYCKKLANGPATHSGQVIHPEIGARGQVPRKLGIVIPDTDANIPAAVRLKEIVDGCDATAALVVAYDADIESGVRQASANTQALIDADVTTVVCFCDPIAAVFRANNQTRNNYFPENLIPGSGLIDYDKLGRLYDPQQWANAFGPSHLAAPVPHAQSDASRIWRAAGRSGNACGSCNLFASYYYLLGWMLQQAGPRLDPLTVEHGLQASAPRGGWDETGGDPRYALFRFGPDDPTGVSDVREVYWSPTAPSAIDGRAGSYVALYDGRRFPRGGLTTAFDVPPSAR